MNSVFSNISNFSFKKNLFLKRFTFLLPSGLADAFLSANLTKKLMPLRKYLLMWRSSPDTRKC